MKSEISIVGAGMAGSVLAGLLAEKGHRVKVYDRKLRPGYPPTASGILSVSGLNASGLPYKNAIRNSLVGARIHAGKALLMVKAKEVKAYVVDRPLLNDIAIEYAESKGASFMLGRQVSEGMLDDMAKGILVGADGAVSIVAKRFSMGHVEKYVLTYKAAFEMENDEHSVDLFFDNALFPGFFAWLCPLSKYEYEAGVGIEPGHGNAKQAFSRFVKHYAPTLLNAKQLEGYASMIPLIGKRRLVDPTGHVLLLGDAAVQVKASTGGGVVLGTKAAKIAANAISRHIAYGEPLASYEKEFKKRFGKDLLLHRLIHRLYSSLSPKSMEMLVSFLSRLGLGSLLSKYGDMDSPTLMLKRMLRLER